MDDADCLCPLHDSLFTIVILLTVNIGRGSLTVIIAIDDYRLDQKWPELFVCRFYKLNSRILSWPPMLLGFCEGGFYCDTHSKCHWTDYCNLNLYYIHSDLCRSFSELSGARRSISICKLGNNWLLMGWLRWFLPLEIFHSSRPDLCDNAQCKFAWRWPL